MKYTRRAGRRDAIEKDIIAIARRHGWRVKQTDEFDLIVQRVNFTALIEVKSGDKPLTALQQKNKDDGWVFYTIRSIAEAEEFFR